MRLWFRKSRAKHAKAAEAPTYATGQEIDGGAYIGAGDLPIVLHALEIAADVLPPDTAVLYRAVAVRLGSDL